VEIRTNFSSKLFRKNLRPAFTITHIKTFAPIFWGKAVEMVQLIEAEFQVDRDSVIDLGDYGNRALLDVLGLAMMGYDFQTLQHPDNEFRNQFRKMVLEPNKAFKWMQLISH
jgi:cytochrome P450